MSYRVLLDADLCDGHARCVEAVPAVFDLGDDDLGRVIDDNPPESERAAVDVAIGSCPKNAISMQA